MDGIKAEINRLCKKLYLDVEETSKDFFRVGKTVDDYDMGFHTSTYMNYISGTGYEVIRFLRLKAGECVSAPMPKNISDKPSLTLAEATWITDLLQLPSNRVEDVRAAVTRVMDARQL